MDDAWIPCGGTINIMSGITFSDHTPVRLVKFGPTDGNVPRLKIPERILLDDRYDRQIREI